MQTSFSGVPSLAISSFFLSCSDGNEGFFEFFRFWSAVVEEFEVLEDRPPKKFVPSKVTPVKTEGPLKSFTTVPPKFICEATAPFEFPKLF
jgi:hypothetical protein